MKIRGIDIATREQLLERRVAYYAVIDALSEDKNEVYQRRNLKRESKIDLLLSFAEPVAATSKTNIEDEY